ncbi:protein GLUTAMINE DUMPER 5 [Alnus glutinosa]|uniref:protein GLUTAMINE DUMPER 5 n=1 Tax=Alnus glutinosa TaxID=3517 RepID=UPI002D772014|nr:protein GLUTAMINE DUMPER 5 [Alnus glutinosa]
MMRSIASPSAASKASSSLSPTPSVSNEVQPQGQRSPWHSPVPYLFGGLAAMLGLIAFALLILACSYWRLAGQFEEREGGDRSDERDLESGAGEGKEGENSEGKVVKVYEEKILVIMAGDVKPTFLATPVFAKAAASFGGGNDLKGENKEGDKADNCETKKKETGELDDHASSEENGDSQETPEAQHHSQ